ncbi:MAG: hypothetical protein V7629_17985 [Motiliproteus sp.]
MPTFVEGEVVEGDGVGVIGLSSWTPPQDFTCVQAAIDYFLQTQQQGAG